MKNKFLPFRKLIAVLMLFAGFAANATTYYISATGNDASNGTSTSTPWKSISKLNSFFSSLKAGDNVLFNRGNTFYGTITIKKSGTSTAPITIGAYGSGSQPVITGFTNVNSWTNLGNNIWESTSSVSTLSYCNVVTVNGVTTLMGRYPNAGYLNYEYFTANVSISSNAISTGINWTGAEAVIKKNDYTIDRCLITNHSGKNITYTDKYGKSDATANYGFFIQNDPRTLDKQNEWYFNPATKKIKIYSSSTPQNVQAATLSNLVYNFGYDNITIDNVAFAGSSDDMILFANSSTDNSTIKNCTLSFAGRVGLFLTMGSNCIIDNNTITDCFSAGIETDAGSGNTISNNVLTNMGNFVGQTVTHSAGIYAASKNVVIKSNVVKNSGYVGISLNSVVGTGLVQYNFVDSAGLIMDDGGGIYTSGPSVGGGVRTIDHNIVLNTFGSREGTSNQTRSVSASIYCDDLSSNVVITNNSVANSVDAGIKMHRANSSRLDNNTIFNCDRFQVFFQNNSYTSDIYKITMTNNILFAKSYTANTKYQWVLGYETQVNDITNFGVADNNFYCRPINENNTIDTKQPSTGYVDRALQSWQAFTGKDANSKKSPKTITDANDLRFEYNASSSGKTINLGAAYIDAKNTSYDGSITLAPYSSAALIKTGPATKNNLLPAVNPSNTVNGLNYKYYESSSYSNVPAFSSITPVETGTVGNFNLSVANRPNNYAVNFTGYINVPADGQYTFYTTSDDGSNLYIDNVQVVDNDGLHGSVEKSGVIGLKAGKHAISVGFFQQSGDDGLSVSYAGPGVSKQDIPSSSLYRISANNLLPAVNVSNLVNGLNYKYFEASFNNLPNFSNLTPVKTGTLSNFSLSPAKNDNSFAFSFTGYINVPSDGQYTFYTNSDDGTNLYIDNVLVVNNDGVHAPLEKSGTIGLQAGNHAISVGFFQLYNGTTFDVNYSGPGISKQAIPNSKLNRVTGSNNLIAFNSALPTVSLPTQTFGVKAFPNPFMNLINVSIAGEAGSYKLLLVNVAGQIIWTKSGVKDSGITQEIINASALQKGIYFLKLSQNNTNTTIKLEK